MGEYAYLMYTLVRHHEPMADYGEIDRTSPVPPYRQIAAVLRRRIEDGEYGPGARLPSVVSLMQTFGVAHLTAQKALRVLVDAGIAEMSPGMGTYVKRQDKP